MKRQISVGIIVGVLVTIASVAQQSVASNQEKASTKKRLAGNAQVGANTKNKGAVLIAKILEVEYAELETQPPTLEVKATCEVPTAGYTNALLTRAVYVTPPAAGVQDYFLTAIPPTGFAAQVVSQVAAKNAWRNYSQEAPWIQGIRVHGIGDGVIEVHFGTK